LSAILTYPHHLIDLAFLVGDSTDDTMAVLSKELERIQEHQKTAFRSVMIVEKNFGTTMKMDVQDRHGFAAQGPRRKTMGKARNFLLSAAMKSDHSWVYWRDVDIKDSHPSIIEHFVAHDRDILVPSTFKEHEKCWKKARLTHAADIWFHRYQDVNGKKQDIEGRCRLAATPFIHGNVNMLQSTTTRGKNPTRGSS